MFFAAVVLFLPAGLVHPSRVSFLFGLIGVVDIPVVCRLRFVVIFLLGSLRRFSFSWPELL